MCLCLIQISNLLMHQNSQVDCLNIDFSEEINTLMVNQPLINNMADN